MKVLFVDNFDSFTYNVAHLLAAQGALPDVYHNDHAALGPELLDQYEALVVGPGPGNPGQIPGVVELIRLAAKKEMPVFGVCLGLQAIGEAFGGRTAHAPAVMHGKTSTIAHSGSRLFEGIPSPVRATRYHSLCIQPDSLPEELQVSAWSPDDGVIQAVEHRTLPVSGVQFHPESVLSEHGARIFRNALGIGH